MIERIGKCYALVLERYQKTLEEYALLSEKQIIDFSSTYFEGKAGELGEVGFSRDGQRNKKQITFGIATGINGIPTALTVQKGNTQDKKHFGEILKAAEAILEVGSILLFDCGANSKKNKAAIRERGLNYLTLKAKKKGPYLKAIRLFRAATKYMFNIGDQVYECVKIKHEDEFWYIYFSEKLFNEQMALKDERFQKELKKNNALLKKTKNGEPLGQYPTKEGTVIATGSLQKTLDDSTPNPQIKGVEGFFILESSVDDDPKKILELYKQRDKAEKLIRSIKEGTELHPLRCWDKNTIIGSVTLIFLTNFLVSLTLLKAKNPTVKNTKLLKNYLTKLTVTVIYPPKEFRVAVLTNVTPEILSILGSFVEKYQDRTLKLRW